MVLHEVSGGLLSVREIEIDFTPHPPILLLVTANYQLPIETMAEI